jgi:hypothetical protein
LLKEDEDLVMMQNLMYASIILGVLCLILGSVMLSGAEAKR